MTKLPQPTAENVRPIRDFVLLQPQPHQEATSGGIVIPKTVRDKTQMGVVLAVGPGRVTDRGFRIEPEVKRGDVVVYLENSIAQRITPQSKEGSPVILPEIEIVAVVEV
jgi:co-chaperonin GroES (HSP10)